MPSNSGTPRWGDLQRVFLTNLAIRPPAKATGENNLWKDLLTVLSENVDL